MDLCTKLPQAGPKALPVTGKSGVDKHNATEESTAADAIGLSFSGVLRQIQDKPQPEIPQGDVTGQTEENGGSTAASANLSVTAPNLEALIFNGDSPASDTSIEWVEPTGTPAAAAAAALAPAAAGATLAPSLAQMGKAIPAADQPLSTAPEKNLEMLLRGPGIKSLEIQPTGGQVPTPAQPGSEAQPTVDMSGVKPGPEISNPPVQVNTTAPGVPGEVNTAVAPDKMAIPGAALENQATVATIDPPVDPAPAEKPAPAAGAETPAETAGPLVEATVVSDSPGETGPDPDSPETSTPAREEAKPDLPGVEVKAEDTNQSVPLVAQDSVDQTPKTAEAVPSPESVKEHEGDAALDKNQDLRTLGTDRPTARSTKVSGLESSVRRQVFSQVAGNLKQTGQGQKLTIRLNPENLGQVDVQFETRDNRMEIIMTASGPEAEKALQEGARELADRLVDRQGRWQVVDIRVESRNSDQDRSNNTSEDKKDRSGRDGRRGEHQKDNEQDQGQGHQWAQDHQGG